MECTSHTWCGAADLQAVRDWHERSGAYDTVELQLAGGRIRYVQAVHAAASPPTHDLHTAGPAVVAWEGDEEWPVAAHAVARRHADDPDAEETVLVAAEIDYSEGPPWPYTLVHPEDYCTATLRVRLDPPVVSYLAARRVLLGLADGGTGEETGEGGVT